MKITPIYKNRLITLPAETVLQKLSTATKEELAVLIAVTAEPEFETADICSRLDITENVFNRALAMWVDAGAVICDDIKASASKNKPDEDKTEEKNPEKEKNNGAKKKSSKNIVIHSMLPDYTNDEISDIIERRPECFELVNACQQVMGKIFNAHETSIIVGLMEHLSLSSEYILLLCTHAVQMQKKTLRYIEQLAINFYDNDVITYSALEEELKMIEERASVEAYVRGLFGMGKRALIPKEREYIKTWNDKYKFSREMISAAYEITVSKTGEANIKYANAILDNWYAAGYKNIDDVKAAEAERAKKRESEPQSSSFSTDDFYEAALLRSYKSDK